MNKYIGVNNRRLGVGVKKFYLSKFGINKKVIEER